MDIYCRLREIYFSWFYLVCHVLAYCWSCQVYGVTDSINPLVPFPNSEGEGGRPAD